eukprot:9569446-Heterocapsa_arctica.AAC.1
MRVDAGLRQHVLDEQAFLRARAEREELSLASRERNNGFRSAVRQQDHAQVHHDAARRRTAAWAVSPARITDHDDLLLVSALHSSKS